MIQHPPSFPYHFSQPLQDTRFRPPHHHIQQHHFYRQNNSYDHRNSNSLNPRPHFQHNYMAPINCQNSYNRPSAIKSLQTIPPPSPQSFHMRQDMNQRQNFQSFQHHLSPQTASPPKSFQETIISSNKLEHINQIIAPTDNFGGLYIGDSVATKMPSILEQNKINGVLCCNKQASNNLKQLGKQLYFKFLNIEDSYDYPIKKHFEHCFNFIEFVRIQGNVLIQCHAGVSRSGAVLCAYLMKKNNWRLSKALQFSKQKRHRINPNKGFYQQLVQYEKQLNLCSEEQIEAPVLETPRKKQLSEDKTDQQFVSLNPEKVRAFSNDKKMERESPNFLRNTLSYIPNFSETLDPSEYYSPQMKYPKQKNNIRLISSHVEGPRSTSVQNEKSPLSNSNLFIIEERGIPNKNYGIKRSQMMKRAHPTSNYMPQSRFTTRGRGINLTIGHKFETMKKFC